VDFVGWVRGGVGASGEDGSDYKGLHKKDGLQVFYTLCYPFTSSTLAPYPVRKGRSLPVNGHPTSASVGHSPTHSPPFLITYKASGKPRKFAGLELDDGIFQVFAVGVDCKGHRSKNWRP
jgi:hypothetical protein